MDAGNTSRAKSPRPPLVRMASAAPANPCGIATTSWQLAGRNPARWAASGNASVPASGWVGTGEARKDREGRTLRHRARGDNRRRVGGLIVVAACEDLGRGEAPLLQGPVLAGLPRRAVTKWTHRTRRRVAWAAALMVAGEVVRGSSHGLAVTDRMKRPCAQLRERTGTNVIGGPTTIAMTELEAHRLKGGCAGSATTVAFLQRKHVSIAGARLD